MAAPPRRPEVAILGGRPEGWHGARLREALAAFGLAARRVAFDHCALEAGPNGARVRLDGFPQGHTPAAAVVRSIPAGSFEQVTLRLGLLHALEAVGVPVTNPARAIERCVDKAAASFFLARAGVPTPPTWAVERPEAAAELVRREAPLVLKPLFGAQGRGLRLVERPDDLPPPEEVAGGVHYLQRFVGRPDAGGAWRDFRVLVVGGRAVAAMARRGSNWVTNVRQGGVPEPVPARGRLAELAVSAAAALGTDHAGVDLIEDPDNALLVLEVNSMPAWQGLQGVSDADIARHLAADVAARLQTEKPGARAPGFPDVKR